MLSLIIKLRDTALDILFPPLCINCRRYLDDRNKLICEQCLSLIKLNNTLFCPNCRARLAENKNICRHKKQYSYLLAAAGDYSDQAIQNLIHYFKYKSFEKLTPILGDLLIKYLIENCKLKIENFVIVPIPLHPQRERERGFNQAELLAEFISKNLNLELIDGLKRIQNTKPQSRLKNGEARQRNVYNCFRMKNPDALKGKKIVLIDDVFTSGFTMNEAVKTLKAAGVKTVIALVIAKT